MRERGRENVAKGAQAGTRTRDRRNEDEAFELNGAPLGGIWSNFQRVLVQKMRFVRTYEKIFTENRLCWITKLKPTCNYEGKLKRLTPRYGRKTSGTNTHTNERFKNSVIPFSLHLFTGDSPIKSISSLWFPVYVPWCADGRAITHIQIITYSHIKTKTHQHNKTWLGLRKHQGLA